MNSTYSSAKQREWMARNLSTMTSALIVVESERGTVMVVWSGEGNEVWVCGGSKWSRCGQHSVLQRGMGGRGDGEEQRCRWVIYEAAARLEISGTAFLSSFWRALFWKQILTSFGLDLEKNLCNCQRLTGDSPATISQWIVRPRCTTLRQLKFDLKRKKSHTCRWVTYLCDLNNTTYEWICISSKYNRTLPGLWAKLVATMVWLMPKKAKKAKKKI